MLLNDLRSLCSTDTDIAMLARGYHKMSLHTDTLFHETIIYLDDSSIMYNTAVKFSGCQHIWDTISHVLSSIFKSL